MGCKRYLESFLIDACAAGILEIADIPFASKQFVYQLKSFVFYPTLFGLEKQTKTMQEHIIDEAVAMFLARYQKH
jgi:TetR/AcrR family transcriptional regulator of autoinduction and epiphytic fitness